MTGEPTRSLDSAGRALVCGASACTAYETAINQFFTDVAADSGTSTNVFATDTQYAAPYASTFGGSTVDTAAYPTNGCNDGVDAACLTDEQLENEIQTVISAQGWTDGKSSLFFILTPSGVGICADSTGTECSSNVFCAYHSGFIGTDGNPVLYAVEPDNASIYGCNPGESPNGDDADASINTLSHEMNEAITDPWGNAWYTDAEPYGSGEIGDLCAWEFGLPLGSTAYGEYNQTINGDHYWLQGEWSNTDNSCVWSYSGATSPTTGDYMVDHGGWVMPSSRTYVIYWMPNGSPDSTAAPTISGTTAVNHVLTSTTGSWDSAPTGYEYQWQRCSASGAGCTNIAGATGSTYTLQVADAGQTVRSTVSATNALGASSYVASAVSALVMPLPATTATPVVTGRAGIGKTLSTTPGTWNTPMTFAYQWLRCNAAGAACTPIGGATDSTYVVKSADGGHTLQARVSATNESGTTAALSNVTGLVVAEPAATHAPRISGRAKAGRTLRAAAGSWSGSPTGFAYQWLRCNAKGAHCVRIGHATRPTYKAAKRDVGHRLRVRVTARNRAGGAAATSTPSAKIHR